MSVGASGQMVNAPGRPAVERRLAAIVIADVVGYTRLMERDDTGTFARLHTIRDEVIPDPPWVAITEQIEGSWPFHKVTADVKYNGVKVKTVNTGVMHDRIR